jgi:hypothetical protein
MEKYVKSVAMPAKAHEMCDCIKACSVPTVRLGSILGPVNEEFAVVYRILVTPPEGSGWGRSVEEKIWI